MPEIGRHLRYIWNKVILCTDYLLSKNKVKIQRSKLSRLHYHQQISEMLKRILRFSDKIYIENFIDFSTIFLQYLMVPLSPRKHRKSILSVAPIIALGRNTNGIARFLTKTAEL